MDTLVDAIKDSLDSFTVGGAAKSLAAVWAGYRVLIALYNISPFHPLAKFPGPKIAAAGYFYEAYYDWIRGGRYTHEIKRMHEQYGKHLNFFNAALSKKKKGKRKATMRPVHSPRQK